MNNNLFIPVSYFLNSITGFRNPLQDERVKSFVFDGHDNGSLCGTTHLRKSKINIFQNSGNDKLILFFREGEIICTICKG